MFSKFTGVLLLVTAPAGVWLAAQPAPAPVAVVSADVQSVDATLLSRDQAVTEATNLLGGKSGEAALTFDAEADALVWQVQEGQERVRVDAKTGDILEMAW